MNTHTTELEKLQVRTKVWLMQDKQHVFGPGLARLLQLVDHLGTLRGASRECGMSYRHAWSELKKAETHLEGSLVTRTTGGKGGGGMRLTNLGRDVLELYNRMNEKVRECADRNMP